MIFLHDISLHVFLFSMVLLIAACIEKCFGEIFIVQFAYHRWLWCAKVLFFCLFFLLLCVGGYAWQVLLTFVFVSAIVLCILPLDSKYVFFSCFSKVSCFSALAIFCAAIFVFLSNSIRFFSYVDFANVFSFDWSPFDKIKVVDGMDVASFGVFPLFLGSLLVGLIAMLTAMPAGILVSLYLVGYAAQRFINLVTFVMELASGIPTVVYGYFAVMCLAPFVRFCTSALNFNVPYENAFVTGFVIGIMMIPSVCLMSFEVFSGVPKSLRYASFALGATRNEMLLTVMLKSSISAILSIALLSFARVLGETMIVLVSSGLSPNVTFNPFQPVTTVTAQIARVVTGESSADSLLVSSAYVLAMILFCITWIFNFLSIMAIKRFNRFILHDG